MLSGRILDPFRTSLRNVISLLLYPGNSSSLLPWILWSGNSSSMRVWAFTLSWAFVVVGNCWEVLRFRGFLFLGLFVGFLDLGFVWVSWARFVPCCITGVVVGAVVVCCLIEARRVNLLSVLGLTPRRGETPDVALSTLGVTPRRGELPFKG